MAAFAKETFVNDKGSADGRDDGFVCFFGSSCVFSEQTEADFMSSDDFLTVLSIRT